jgi:hypothetical protein
MPSLRELQLAFADALLADGRAVAAHIRPGRFAPERHLGVYRNNVHTTLTDALGDIHPVVRRLVGDEFFAHAAGRYLRAHPPASGNLHDFGDRFAAFLAGFAPAAGLVYLPEVARLEWAWHEAFHAPEAPPLRVETLARVAPADYPRLRFRLHPSARLVDSPYPVLRIWQANQPDYSGDPIVDLDEGGCRVLVIRRGFSVELRELSEPEFVLLASLADGRRLEEAIGAAVARVENIDPSSLLRRCVADEVVVDISV